MNKSRMQGVFAPIVTVFDQDENIVYPDIVENIRRYNNTELCGYMPLGSNGEYQGLTDAESFSVLDAVCANSSSDKVIVGGCGRESALKTIWFIKEAAAHGLDLAFILPPHYFMDKMNDEALFKYYMKVADASCLPIVIYNAPKFSGGLSTSVELIRNLSKHPNIAGMKNSSTVPNRIFVEATQNEDFFILAGNIATFYDGLCDGAIGGVLSTASYLPEYCCRLYQLFKEGKMDDAKILHQFLFDFSNASVGKMGVMGVKLGMDLRGLHGGFVRSPLLNASDQEREQLKRYFEETGITKIEY